jgi:hypothetical protein
MTVEIYITNCNISLVVMPEMNSKVIMGELPNGEEEQ